MAKKKEYHIPTIEVLDMRGVYPLMGIASSKTTHIGAPVHREKAF